MLEGNLSGAWVPSALRFFFGPLAEVTFPEDGFNLDFCNFYEDTFTLADDAFSTDSDVYEVFYTDVVPAGWNRSQQGAEQALFAHAQAFLTNVAATQAEYSQSGYSNIVGPSAASPVDLSATPDTLYIWTGSTDNTVTLGNDNGSLCVIDVDPPVGAVGRLEFKGIGAGDQVFNWFFDLNSLNNAFGTPAASFAPYAYVTAGGSKTLNINQSANVVGGAQGDGLAFYGEDADFLDGNEQGAGERDVFFANFLTGGYASTAVNWDFKEALDSGNGTDLDLGGHIVTIRDVESIALSPATPMTTSLLATTRMWCGPQAGTTSSM